MARLSVAAARRDPVIAGIRVMEGQQRNRGPRDDAGALRSEVTGLLERAAHRLGDPDGELARLNTVVDEPLTVAVAGHTNAGKSTLVNALIGHRIAPTAPTECTRVITWYRYGPDQPEIVGRDGSRQPLWLVDDPQSGQRRLPEHLPVAEDTVQRLDVPMTFDDLRNLTVIDTPGLSGDEGLAHETETLLASGTADVLLFVFGGADIRGSERNVVTDFRRRSRSRYAFPGNALGVLSQADKYRGEDPMAAARIVADAHAATLRRQLAGVLPIMGRVAETIKTGAFNQTHTDSLHTIAALPDPERTAMLRTPLKFQESDTLGQAALSRARRMALVERLAIHGIRTLTEPRHASSSTDALYHAMAQMSGMGTLQTRIEVLFTRPRVVHKTTRILAEVARLTRHKRVSEAARGKVLDDIQVLRDSDAMHALDELRALCTLYSAAGTLGDDAVRAKALKLFEAADPAHRLGCAPDDPTALHRIAVEAIGYWQSYANATLDGTSAMIALTATRSASMIARRVEERS